MTRTLVTPEGKEVQAVENIADLGSSLLETYNNVNAGVIDAGQAAMLSEVARTFIVAKSAELKYHVKRAEGLAPVLREMDDTKRIEETKDDKK